MLLKKRFVVGLGVLDGPWVPQPEGGVQLQFAATTSASMISQTREAQLNVLGVLPCVRVAAMIWV